MKHVVRLVALGLVVMCLPAFSMRSAKDVFNYQIKLNNRLAALMRVAQSAEARPTDQIYTVFKVLSDELDVKLRALDDVVKQGLARFNASVAARGMDTVK